MGAGQVGIPRNTQAPVRSDFALVIRTVHTANPPHCAGVACHALPWKCGVPTAV